MRSQYHSAYSPLGANDGTEYTPQWMKIPNFASLHHCGVGRLSMDSHVGAYRFVSAAKTCPTSDRHNRETNVRIPPSVGMEALGHVRPPLLRAGGRPFLL